MEIQELNKRANYYEWDELLYDAWEMFNEPMDILQQEKEFAKTFMSILKIDLDEAVVITFKSAPCHIYYLAIQIYRHLNRNDFQITIPPFHAAPDRIK